MKPISKIIFIILISAFISSGFNFALAQEKAEINFFFSPSCPHCAKEKVFLDDLEQRYPEIKVKRFSVYEKENVDLLKKFYQEYEVPKEKWGLVPITFSKEGYFLGFNKTIGQEIEACVKRCLVNQENKQKTKEKISLPIVGQIDASKYSLPILTVILGVLDGFNICSLGALILILALVLTLRSRKKILILGGIFLLTTALTYGLLIFLWYQIFSFLAPYLKIMEILIGLLGVGGGIYFLRQFIRYKKCGLACGGRTGQQIVSKFSSKLKNSFENQKIFAVAGTVFLFAAVITIVEFPCSAAVPVFFAGILSRSQLPPLLYLGYISFYIIFYLLDEIIIFLGAFLTMKIWFSSNKAITWITLIETIILFGLGFYYLFGFGALF